MIFKTSVLKKMMKTAYNGNGLYACNQKGRIILAGGWWCLSVEEGVFPKKAKAALVELLGELPAAGESFRCTSAGNQMEMPLFDLMKEIEEVNWEDQYERKGLILESGAGLIRPYQNDTETIFLSELITDLMDGTVEPGEDEGLSGPGKIRSQDNMVFMETDTCSIAVWEIKASEDDGASFSGRNKLMQDLSTLKLPVSR